MSSNDDMDLPMPPGVLVCRYARPTNKEKAEMWRFVEYLEDIRERGADIVNRDPKWREYLGLDGE